MKIDIVVFDLTVLYDIFLCDDILEANSPHQYEYFFIMTNLKKTKSLFFVLSKYDLFIEKLFFLNYTLYTSRVYVTRH